MPKPLLTVRLDELSHRQLKTMSAETGSSMQEIAERAITLALVRHARERESSEVRRSEGNGDKG